MEKSPASGYYYANKLSRLALQALEEVMGKNGVNAILHLADLPQLIDNYPPDNLERQFDFSDFSAINQGLEEMYGPRGGRGLALRAGRAVFDRGLRNFGALAGVGDLAFKILPLQTKLRIGLPAMAKIFSQTSDQYTTSAEFDTYFIYTIHRCPVCWGRTHADKPVCHIARGVIEEALKWVSGGSEFRVNETRCIAMGDPVCDFVIQKDPIG